MRAGHKLDANTLALYRMDEASGDLIDIGPNGWNLAISSGSPGVVEGRIGGGRSITSSTTRFSRATASTAALYTALTTGPFTWGFWINLNGVTAGGTMNLFLFNGSTVFAIQLSAARHLAALFGGVTTLSASGAVPATGWAFCECVVGYDAGTPTQRTVEWRVNGVTSGTPATITPTFGANAASFSVGAASSARIASYDDFRISNIARSPAESLETYERGIGSRVIEFGQTRDPYTLALWRLEEWSGNVVDAVNGWTLTPTGNVSTVTGVVGIGRQLDDVNARLAIAMSSVPALYTQLTGGAFSVGFWINLNNVAQATANVIVAGGGSIFTVQLTTGRTLTALLGSASVISAVGAVPATGWTFCECRVTYDSPTLRTVSWIVNGVVSGTPTQVAPAFAAPSGSFTIGHTTGTSRVLQFDNLRISTIARSNAEGLTSYRRGAPLVTRPLAPSNVLITEAT